MTNKERAEDIVLRIADSQIAHSAFGAKAKFVEQALDAAVNEATEGYRQRIAELEQALRDVHQQHRTDVEIEGSWENV